MKVTQIILFLVAQDEPWLELLKLGHQWASYCPLNGEAHAWITKKFANLAIFGWSKRRIKASTVNVLGPILQHRTMLAMIQPNMANFAKEFCKFRIILRLRGTQDERDSLLKQNISKEVIGMFGRMEAIPPEIGTSLRHWARSGGAWVANESSLEQSGATTPFSYFTYPCTKIPQCILSKVHTNNQNTEHLSEQVIPEHYFIWTTFAKSSQTPLNPSRQCTNYNFYGSRSSRHSNFK